MLFTEWNWDDAYRIAREEAMEIGMEHGLEEGRKQGIAQGIEQGIEQGIAQGKREAIQESIYILKTWCLQMCWQKNLSCLWLKCCVFWKLILCQYNLKSSVHHLHSNLFVAVAPKASISYRTNKKLSRTFTKKNVRLNFYLFRLSVPDRFQAMTAQLTGGTFSAAVAFDAIVTGERFFPHIIQPPQLIGQGPGFRLYQSTSAAYE